jgi:hypothetical protein
VHISEWQPGELWDVSTQTYLKPAPKYNVVCELPTMGNSLQGKYILAVACLDPAGDKPSLRFANTNYFNGGYHPIGYVGVNSDVKDFSINEIAFDDIQSDRTLKYVFIK